jgi:hypothetical protein
MSADGQRMEIIRRRKRLVIFFLISLVLTICLGGIFLITSFQGFIDFPCFVEVVDGELRLNSYEQIDQTNHAMLFITTYYAHMSGGGCIIEELEDGESITVGDYQVQVNGDTFIIDEESIIQIGERFEDIKKRFGLNPWWWYEDSLNLTNQGFVHGVLTHDEEFQELDQEILVVTGNKGSREKLNPITAALFCLTLNGTIILGPYLLIRWIRDKGRS